MDSLLLMDTNAILGYLDGRFSKKELNDQAVFCVVSIQRVELLGFHRLAKVSESLLLNFFRLCHVISVDELIIEGAVRLRKKWSIETVDALIAASAIEFDIPLVSYDRDFERVEELRLINPKSFSKN